MIYDIQNNYYLYHYRHVQMYLDLHVFFFVYELYCLSFQVQRQRPLVSYYRKCVDDDDDDDFASIFCTVHFATQKQISKYILIYIFKNVFHH